MIDETKRHVIVVVTYPDRSVLGLYEDGDVWTLKDSHTDRTAGQFREVTIPSDWPRADHVMFGFGGGAVRPTADRCRPGGGEGSGMSDRTFDEAVIARIVEQRERAADAITAGDTDEHERRSNEADRLAMMRPVNLNAIPWQAQAAARQRREDIALVIDWIDQIVRPRVRTTPEIDAALERLLAG